MIDENNKWLWSAEEALKPYRPSDALINKVEKMHREKPNPLHEHFLEKSKYNRLLGLTMDQIKEVDPWKMKLNDIEIEYAKKRWKEYEEDIEWKATYYKQERDEVREELKISIKEYEDLENQLATKSDELEIKQIEIIADAIPRIIDNLIRKEEIKREKRKIENKGLDHLRKQQWPINQKHYDPNRKPNKKEEKDAELHVFINYDEILKTDNQKKVFKFLKDQKPNFIFLVAAKVGGIYSNNKYKADFISENLLIQLNVINSAYKNGIKNLIFLGVIIFVVKVAFTKSQKTKK